MAEPGKQTSGREQPSRDKPVSSGGANGEAKNIANGEEKNIAQQVRSTATEAFHSAKTNTAAKIEDQKSTLSGGLSNLAENVRKLGDGITKGDQSDPISRFAAEYSGMAADKLEAVADYFTSHDLNAIYRDTESFARRNPTVVVGGAFALGFLAARFFKSSSASDAGRGAGTARSDSQRSRLATQRAMLGTLI